MNFAADEDKENCVAGDDDQSWDEEADEADNGILDVAKAPVVAVLPEAKCKSTRDDWQAPAGNMVEFLQLACLTVTTHNHLIKVERDAESPEEVRQEKVVDENGNDDAHGLLMDDQLLVGNQKGGEANVNADTQVHNELDRIRSDSAENGKSDKRQEGADN